MLNYTGHLGWVLLDRREIGPSAAGAKEVAKFVSPDGLQVVIKTAGQRPTKA